MYEGGWGGVVFLVSYVMGNFGVDFGNFYYNDYYFYYGYFIFIVVIIGYFDFFWILVNKVYVNMLVWDVVNLSVVD